MNLSGVKTVVIGGGTGSFTLLKTLKNYTHDITALVNMTDDGGSTGILRDELGVLPPGDVRQCLVALSNAPYLRDVLSYRFEDGTFKGHAFGNLLMAALEKVSGSFTNGVSIASEILNITGKVEPVLINNVKLCMKTADGKTYKGQHTIEQSNFKQTRPELWLEPNPEVNQSALSAVEQADYIIVAPGNLYASLAPALLVPEVGHAIKASKAKKVFVCNLVTKPGQTDGFAVNDFVSEIERFIGGKCIDTVLYNNKKPAKRLLDKYAFQGEFGVEIDRGVIKDSHYTAVGASLIGEVHTSSKSDLMARTLIRHDSEKLARQLAKIYYAA